MEPKRRSFNFIELDKKKNTREIVAIVIEL